MGEWDRLRPRSPRPRTVRARFPRTFTARGSATAKRRRSKSLGRGPRARRGGFGPQSRPIGRVGWQASPAARLHVAARQAAAGANHRMKQDSTNGRFRFPPRPGCRNPASGSRRPTPPCPLAGGRSCPAGLPRFTNKPTPQGVSCEGSPAWSRRAFTASGTTVSRLGEPASLHSLGEPSQLRRRSRNPFSKIIGAGQAPRSGLPVRRLPGVSRLSAATRPGRLAHAGWPREDKSPRNEASMATALLPLRWQEQAWLQRPPFLRRPRQAWLQRSHLYDRP